MSRVSGSAGCMARRRTIRRSYAVCHRRAKIERRRRGGRATGARRERADPAFERWRGAHARRRRFAGDRPARSALGGPKRWRDWLDKFCDRSRWQAPYYKALIQWRNPRDRRSWMRSPTWCSPIGRNPRQTRGSDNRRAAVWRRLVTAKSRKALLTRSLSTPMIIRLSGYMEQIEYNQAHARYYCDRSRRVSRHPSHGAYRRLMASA